MKRIVSIGIVVAAGTLFCWSLPAFAQQDDQPVKRHRSSAQTTPSAPVGSSLPNGPVQRGAVVSPPFGPQSRQLAPAFPSAARLTSPGFERGSNRELPSSPSRQIHRVPRSQTQTTSPRKTTTSTSKKKATTATRGEHGDRPGGAEHGERQATSPPPRQPEHAAATPARTPAIQAPPNPAPEAPPMMVPNAPPVVAAPAERILPSAAPQTQAQPRAQHAPPLSDLSDDERTRFQSAHSNAMHDPNLAASRARYLDARKEFRQKLRDALLKADPSVQPILEKIRRDKPDDH